MPEHLEAITTISKKTSLPIIKFLKKDANHIFLVGRIFTFFKNIIYKICQQKIFYYDRRTDPAFCGYVAVWPFTNLHSLCSRSLGP